MIPKLSIPAFGFAAACAATPVCAAQSFVASSGDDGNACTKAAPCATFAKAITVAGAGGEVTCLNRGNYVPGSSLAVTFSVSILCGQGDGDVGFAILTIQTGSADVVVLQGIVSDFRNTTGSPVIFNAAGALHIRNSVLRNSSNGSGVRFEPNGPGNLTITDSFIDGNAQSGVLIKPQAGGYANAHLRNVRVENNRLHGVFADGTSSDIGINVNIVDGSVTGNAQNGVGAFNGAGGAPVHVAVMGTQVTGNNINGIGALGTAVSGPGSAAVKIGNSMIVANANGLATGATGQILTLGGNQLHSNGNNGTFTGAIATQ